MIYHIIAFVGGFILDLILGDPYSLPHPIRWIGSLIGYLERKLNKKDISEKSAQKRGCIMVIAVCAIVEACVIIVIVYISICWLCCGTCNDLLYAGGKMP